uniref:Uncharacterized protein n=1 Tax=Avena sativa TaxID=4498 RepID=A0ACD5WR43_AVESA
MQAKEARALRTAATTNNDDDGDDDDTADPDYTSFYRNFGILVEVRIQLRSTARATDLSKLRRVMGRKAPPFASTGRKRKGPSFPLLSPCKHRRIPAPAQRTTGWASLPDDIARQVATLVLKYDVVDYIAFRCVCSGWRTCAPTPRDPTLRARSLRPVGWVALCDGDAVRPDDACQITFFHCKTARSLRVHLPELQRHRIIGFTDGLVILLHRRDTTIRVLHPFTRVVVDFPSLVPVYHQLIKNANCLLRMNAAVCTSVSSTTSIITVVAWFPWTPVVVSADAGHPSWKVIHNSMELLNTLPFQGRLYGFLKLSRQIVQVYPPQPLGAAVVAHVPQKFGNPYFCNYYLVESDGHMLLVVKSSNAVGSDVEEWQRYTFVIFKVDVGLSRWKLFRISSICMDSQSFERPTTLCQVHNAKERIHPSVRPFTLADHLLTYCNHREWATGLMFHEYYFIPESFEELWKKIGIQASESLKKRILFNNLIPNVFNVIMHQCG